MGAHLFRIAAVAALGWALTFYPFLPMEYDPLATAASTVVQALAVAGLALTPLGMVWLVYEALQRRRNLPAREGRGRVLATISIIAGSMVFLCVTAIVFLAISRLLGLAMLAGWYFSARRLNERARRWYESDICAINPAPLYLLLAPLAMALMPLIFAEPIADFSRRRAINNSGPLVAAIEQHRREHGRYPLSLHAIWKDYSPEMAGIERYHYAVDGEAFNLSFEQPRLLLDDLGVREWVVYHPLDRHLIPSHASWALLWSSEQLAANQGWHASHTTRHPHWRRFCFD